MITLLGGLVLLAIAWFNRRLSGCVLYPPCLFAAYWALVLMAITASGAALDQPSLQAIGTFVLGAAAFSIGGLPALRRAEGAPQTSLNWLSPKALDLVLIVEVALLPAYIMTMASGRWTGDISKLLLSIRTATVVSANGNAEVVGGFKYVIWLSAVFGMTAAALSRTRHGKTRAAAAMLVSCLYYALTGSRLGLIMMLLALTGIRSILRGRLVVRGAVISIFAIVLSFGLIGASLKKIDTFQGEGVIASVDAVFSSFRQYAIGGPVAFSTMMESQGASVQEGYHVARLPLRYAKLLGIDVRIAPLVQSYSYIPDPINVYSIYSPFYADYGLVGVILGLMTSGFVFTMTFSHARRGSIIGIVGYGLTFAYILLSAADEYLFSLASANLQALAMLAILSWCGWVRRLRILGNHPMVPGRFVKRRA